MAHEKGAKGAGSSASGAGNKGGAQGGQGGASGAGSQGQGESGESGGSSGDDGDDDGEDEPESSGNSKKKATATDKTLQTRNKKLEKENARLKRKLQQATAGQGGGQQQGGQNAGQQQGGTQQNQANTSQPELERLQSDLKMSNARQSFIEAVLDDDPDNKFRAKSMGAAKRLWKLCKDEVEVDEDGDIDNLDSVLKGLKKDAPEFFAGKKATVNGSGDGGSNSRQKMTPNEEMNASIRGMVAAKRGVQREQA